MKYYQSTVNPTPSTSHATVIKIARKEHHKIQKLTPRRQTYVRSNYFKKDKVFINMFWEHLKQKRLNDQVRRARLFACAIDLIRHTSSDPEVVIEKTSKTQLYRFFGKSKSGLTFYVQIKHGIQTNRKDFMSVFPTDKNH